MGSPPPQDGAVFGGSDRRAALLPQQGGAPRCDSRRGRPGLQPAGSTESAAGGKNCDFKTRRRENKLNWADW